MSIGRSMKDLLIVVKRNSAIDARIIDAQNGKADHEHRWSAPRLERDSIFDTYITGLILFVSLISPGPVAGKWEDGFPALKRDHSS